MEQARISAALRQQWTEFCETLPRPSHCERCGASHISWDGRRWRGTSTLHEDEVVHIPKFPCRRARCGGCGCSWTIRPPGFTPRRHYQLDVVAHAVADYLFEAEATEESVARDHDCSRRSVGRWLSYTAHVAEPAELQRRIVETADAPLRPEILEVAGLSRPGRRERQAMLLLAATVLCLLEVLGAALGLPPPGLSSVLERILAGRDRVTTYAAPAIPELAPGSPPGPGGKLPM